MDCAPKVRFAPESQLDEDGFELLVPQEKRWAFCGCSRSTPSLLLRYVKMRKGDGEFESSSSSGESGANLSLAGIRLPTSRSGGFPRVCEPGRAARSAETRRTLQHRA